MLDEDDGSSSEGGLFGAASGWMDEQDSGEEDVGVSRAAAVLSEEIRPENWKFKEKAYWEDRFATEQVRTRLRTDFACAHER